MTRRSPGEGTVYQRNGRWVAEISAGKDHLGNRRRVKRITRTRRDADRQRRDLLSERERGVLDVDASITVSEWCRQWLETGARLTCKERTVAGYTYTLDRWVLPHVGHLELRQLHVGHVEDMQISLLSAGLSVSTVRQARRVLSSALTHAVRGRMITHNPVKDAASPRYEDGDAPQPKAFTEEQAKRLLTVCESYPDVVASTASVIGIALGLRRGELLGIRLSDIDLDAGTVTIRQALNQNYEPTVDGEWLTRLEMSTPKTQHSRRTLHIPPLVRASILRLIEDRRERRRRKGDRWTESGLLFCTSRGTPMWPSNLSKRYKNLLESAGVPRLSIHALRHTFATLCLLNDVPVERVQEAAGHSSVRTTKDIYANFLPDLSTKAIVSLSNVLDPQVDRRHLRVVGQDERRQV